MFPQSLHFEPINTTQYCVSGDVVIHEGAAIAPGVLLQADPGSRIIIRSGVCIGLGSVIHAYHGTITINEGANLGAGVLLIGDVSIGARACLGSAVTVLDESVGAGAMVASGTVLGDRSRQVDLDALLNSIPMNEPEPPEPPSVHHIDDFEPVHPAGVSNSNFQAPDPWSTEDVPPPSSIEPPQQTPIAENPQGVTDNSGRPWQPCDPNPWDPTDNPAGETTCRVSMPDRNFEPFDDSPWSETPYSAPFPPYPGTPTPSTDATTGGMNSAVTEPPASAHPQPNHPNETQFFAAYPTPPATSAETNSWLNDGEPSPISAHPQPTHATGEVIETPQPADTDLSPDEMQAEPQSPVEPQSPAETPAPENSQSENSQLATNQKPKQVYGQAYVNQMLGKMLGR